MGNDQFSTSRAWFDLERKEAELKWGGCQPGHGPQFDSLGREANPSHHFNAAWGDESKGRVGRLRSALRDSGHLAQGMIGRSLSDIDLSTIWHVLLSACEDMALYYGATVVAGGFVGGVGGAFFGGVGAGPGAAAGAAAGGYAGGWVLAMLGLKSLLEGFTQGLPGALQHYERGFLEAWGPTRQDRQFSYFSCSTGSASAAAFHFAQGHVAMISAILSALTAYLTRGKGDKAVLLAEIRQSKRLGPKMAEWVEKNEGKLRKHPALRPHRGGAVGDGEPPPPPPRKGGELEPPRPRRMPPKKVPCFSTNGLPKGNVPEFDRQLAGQEAGINKMTVGEYLRGRAAFQAKETVRDPKIARSARAEHAEYLKTSMYDELRSQGVAIEEAESRAARIAADKMTTLAALHNPDMVAGGKDAICDFGDCNINKRIGAQWNRGQRLSELDRAANEIPATMRGSVTMNARLERCK